MRFAICLFVTGVAAATAAFDGSHRTAATIHLADLPPGVVAALGLTLADPGQPYQVGDAIDPAQTLPSGRLIWARHTCAGWRVQYERGGRGHYYVVATLRPAATGWTVATERSLKPQL